MTKSEKTRVLILGKGLVGSALIKRLSRDSKYDIVGVGRKECDLRDSDAVKNLFSAVNPAIAIFAAGVVGGIEKNLDSPAELIMENSRIILNVVEESISCSLPRLINLVPACVYPADLNFRMHPRDLFSAPMESSSLPYSTAKMAGVIMVDAIRRQDRRDWFTLISTNLYGDDSAIESHKAHVIPALMKKFKEAKRMNSGTIALLGDGTPLREFLHADDLAEAVANIMELDQISEGILNVAGPDSISIRGLAKIIKKVVGFEGAVLFSNDGKNGAPMKLLDGSQMREFGWEPSITLEQGLRRVQRFNFGALA